MKYNTKKYKTLQDITRIYEKFEKHLIPCNCAACRF